MPHANVLDLGIFPAMSKRHTDLAREWNGLGVLKEDEVWRAADAVFRQYEESKIAATFIHMSRLMKKVIKERGGNSFVGKEGSLSCDVRKDFYETEAGEGWQGRTTRLSIQTRSTCRNFLLECMYKATRQDLDLVMHVLHVMLHTCCN